MQGRNEGEKNKRMKEGDRKRKDTEKHVREQKEGRHVRDRKVGRTERKIGNKGGHNGQTRRPKEIRQGTKEGKKDMENRA